MGHVARMVEVSGAYKIMVGKYEKKISVGKLTRRWENNIKMNPGEIVLERVDWIHLALDIVMILRVP